MKHPKHKRGHKEFNMNFKSAVFCNTVLILGMMFSGTDAGYALEEKLNEAALIDKINAIEKSEDGKIGNNPSNLGYINAAIEKCKTDGLTRQSQYWEIRRAAAEGELELLRLQLDIYVMKKNGQQVPLEKLASLDKLKSLKAEHTLTGTEKIESDAICRKIDIALTSLNLPYGWHLVKLYLLKDLVNRCARADFYRQKGKKDFMQQGTDIDLETLQNGINIAIGASIQWEADYGDCFYGRREQSIIPRDSTKLTQLLSLSEGLSDRLAIMENKRQELENKVLAFLNPIDPSGKFSELGIPLRNTIRIEKDGIPDNFILAGLDFGYYFQEPLIRKPEPLCFDVFDFEFYGLPMKSRAVVQTANPGRLEAAKKLAQNENYAFKQPLIVNSHLNKSYYLDFSFLPEPENTDLRLQDQDGKPIGNLPNIWHPAVRSLVADNLRAAAKYAAENIPNLLLFEKLAWEGAGLGYHKDVYGYNKEALAAFRAKMSQKFKSIEILNKAWRSNYRSFDDINFPPSPFRNRNFKPDALSYEFQLFRMESWYDFINHCIRAVQSGAPGIPVGTEARIISSNFTDGTAPSHRLMKSSPAAFYEDHCNNWAPNYAALRMDYDLCLYAGKQPIETEWIWTYPRLIEPKTEEDFRITGELSFWRKMVWGRKILQAFATYGGWGYNAGYYDRAASMESAMNRLKPGAFIRRAAASLVVGKRRAREFWPILKNTEILKPEIALLVPTTSILNEYPFEALYKTYQVYTRTFMRWERLLISKKIDFRYVPEEAILDGDESLADFKVLILPYVTYFPDDLAGKLIEWINNGGTLIAEGIPGVFDSYGFENPELMHSVFGNTVKWEYTGDKGQGTNWSWRLAVTGSGGPTDLPVTLNGQPVMVKKHMGKGSVIVTAIPFNHFTDEGETSTLATAGYLYAETNKKAGVEDCKGIEKRMVEVLFNTVSNIGIVPAAWTRNNSLELVMRTTPKGERYLFAVNPDLHKTITDEVILDADYKKVIDLGLGENYVIPLNANSSPKTTCFFIQLNPGEGTCFKLLKD